MVMLALVLRRITGHWSLSVVLLSALVAVGIAVAVFSPDDGVERRNDVNAVVKG